MFNDIIPKKKSVRRRFRIAATDLKLRANVMLELQRSVSPDSARRSINRMCWQKRVAAV